MGESKEKGRVQGMGIDNIEKSLVGYRRWIGFLCVLGFVVSVYTLYVEISKIKDPSYTAMCDISETVSCTRVLTSEYATGFGVLPKDFWLNQPNCLFGMLMYPVYYATACTRNPVISMVGVGLGAAGVLMSIYLGYILFFVLKGVCLVCISIYIINALLLPASVGIYRTLRSLQTKKKK